MKYAAYELYAAAYPTSRSLNNAKSHVCGQDASGEVVVILCGKAKLEHVADDFLEYPAAETATCKTCLAKLKKLK